MGTSVADATAQASSQAAADQTAADQQAAEAAAKAAADKAAADKASADAAAQVAAQKVPDKYDLKLPEGADVDPAVVERTAATARTLGLGHEAGQQLLDAVTKEITSYQTAQQKAVQPGGELWTARKTELEGLCLADEVIGGSEEKLSKTKELVQSVLKRFGDDTTNDLLNQSLLGFNPVALRFLARIGAAMSESSLVPANGANAAGKLPMAQALYGPDGMGKPKAE